MYKALILVTAMTLVDATGSADARSPADGLTKNPDGIAAVEFLDLAINQNRVDEAASRYLAPPYTQHNPQIPDGIDGVRVGIRGFIKQFPGLHLDFKRVIVDGDLVAVHFRSPEWETMAPSSSTSFA